MFVIIIDNFNMLKNVFVQYYVHSFHYEAETSLGFFLIRVYLCVRELFLLFKPLLGILWLIVLCFVKSNFILLLKATLGFVHLLKTRQDMCCQISEKQDASYSFRNYKKTTNKTPQLFYLTTVRLSTSYASMMTFIYQYVQK